ncbi:uncharacterized protein LOC110067000 isoform X2 [Orbicella faveolata]|uniref:uncharacterized protein LOC110067000 isoform X2 n=1 Tax=Orbicella faveolata TaxID=48498 RepID=UPI0009E1CCA8|nr:uncharacterized protein LOC110067000 isoform X2 [Orbicella faveolata]
MQPLTVLIISIILAGFCLTSYATVCSDRMRTSTCKYLINVYRQKSVDCCKWKSMKTRCAQTCKQCECKDRYPSHCRRRISRFSEAKACNALGKAYCAKSCNVCSEPAAAAQAVPDCIHSPYGCCWDFTAALGPDGEGCRECRNLYRNLCRYWSDYCEPEALRYAGRRTVEQYRVICPVTCRICSPGQKLLNTSRYERQ